MLSKRLWTLLTRMRVAVWLLTALAIVCLLGALFPQMPATIRADSSLRSVWMIRAIDKFGARANLYRSLGLFNVFHTLWFYIPLGLLTINTLVCTLNRLKSTWSGFSRPRSDIPERLFTRLPQQARPSAASANAGADAARRALRRSGFATRPIEWVGDTGRFYAERGRFGLLGTLFVHIGLLLLLFAASARSILAWRDDAVVLPHDQHVSVGHNSNFALRNDGFEVEAYPDSTPRDYRAYVTVLEGGREAEHATIRVNHPLNYRGIKFYLHSVTEGAHAGDEPTITVMVVHDPSYPLVVTAGVSLLLGLFLAFQVPHNRVWIRVDSDGLIRLAGTTNKLENGFTRRFGRLSERLEQALLEDHQT